ncbi:YeiH family protein [Halosolutus amylolyticus]|uniref:YeiH family protein n=1 Tax=Halosolutus amylolyticus TaxID=2932267 RepID=A0ABD5PKB4_9EURY|nr:putative sulfate exporter family transporter [Halosolutus amylolyticus]
MAKRQSVLPGLALLAAVAIAASAIAAAVPRIDSLILAIAIGAILGNAVGVPAWAGSGIQTYSVVLETAIVLLGARIALDQIATAGPVVVALVVGVIAFGVLFVELLSRRVFDLSPTSGSLLAAGSSVCGVSAVVAVGSSIRANEDQLAYAAATVLLFDAVTLFAFPLAGSLLDLGPRTFGVWAGLSMFSTGPVAAAGFAHSGVAGEWATITKLVRNSFIGVLAVGYAAIYLRSSADDSVVNLRQLWTSFPKFLVGFLLVATVANSGVLPAGSIESISTTADWLFLVAFAGLGFDVRLSKMRDAGARPALVVLVYLVTVSVLALVAVTMLL